MTKLNFSFIPQADYRYPLMLQSKANDLYNKVRALQENPASSVAFLTGTPISNSAVEMYTVMRYLAPQQLKDMGLEHFDAWRAQFVEASAAFEPTESGSLKEVTRLGRSWSNMRSLMDLYYEFTDAVSLEDIQRWYSEDNGGKPFPVPKVKGGERKLVNVKPTAAQEAELRETIAGFDGLKDIQDPYERNAARLRLMDRARKLSLDVRAVDPRSSSDEAGGKLDRASQEIKRIYDQWSADRGAQMVFLDRSVPKAKGDDKVIKEYDALVAKRDEALAKDDTEGFQNAQDALDKFDANEISELRNAQAGGWNAYQQIKDNLIAMGVPANEIRFIQEANNDEQKQALFDAVNSGQVRVLIGSSQRMGAGTNAQKRLVGLHHIDVTWKPSDIEQREGRIIRQGNELLAQYGDGFEVEILAYATERTVDAKMWDLNATKLKTINGIRKYDGAFSMDFEDEDSVSMAEMAALASGNPLLLERVKTDSEINMLELQERAFRRRMYGAQDALQSAQRAISQNPKLIERAKAQEAVASRSLQDAKARKEARKVEIEGKEYDSLISAYAAAKEAIEVQQAGKANARYSVAVDGKRVSSKEAIDAAIGEALGDASLFEAEIGGRMVIQRTAAARELAARLNTLTKGIVQKDSRTETVGSMMGFDLVLDSSAYSGYEGDTLVDSALSLVSKEGETVTSLPLSTVMVNQSYVTSNLTNATTQLFNSVERLAEGYGSKQLQRQLDRAKSELPELQSKVGQSFPKAEDLAAKRGRLRELVSLLDGANHDIRFGRSNIGQQGAQNGQENGMPRGLSATSTAQSRTLEDKINANLRTKPKGATTSTIRHAASRAYGKLLERLEAKGLVHVAQTEEDALQAAAKARAAKTGQSVAQELNGLRRSMGADEGDNIDAKLSQDGAIEGFFDRQTGKSFLVADNLTEASAPGTLMHEVGIHMAAGGKLEPLFKRAGSLLKTGTQNEFIQRVKARMARAGETSDEEAAAYIVTEYENDRAKAPITIGKWLADLTAAVRAWLFGKGVILKAEQLTVADIAAVARANARSMARGGPNGGPTGGQAFSRNIGDAMPHPFTGFTREKFLGKPKITPDSNSKDLIPSGGKSIDDKPAVPFSNKWYPNLVARYSENGAAVYDGEKVIASYYFGDTLVVDKKYRRAGIGSELVYQWRMRNPNSKTAATRTKKSQALQEKVWDRVQRELYQQEYGQAFSRTALPATLNIDGKDRPTTNSNGQPIYPTEEGVRNFYRWFGDSRVVDDQGRPLVVYHGTDSDIILFDGNKTMDGSFWFTNDPKKLSDGEVGAAANGVVMPVYLKSKKLAGWDKYDRLTTDQLIQQGFDGVQLDDDFIIFNPTQIKSATGNTGAFDSKNPDIRFSRASPTTGAGVWQAPEATKFDQYTYLLQDKQIDSKRVVNAIKENGKQIADDLDVYLQETLFHGRAAKRVKDFAEQEELPLIELLRDKGLELSELEEYLHARHAPEANWEMSERNPNKAMIEERLKKAVENIAAVEVSLRRAPTDKNIRKEMLDAEAELSKWRNAKPYKGEESDRLALSGMSNEEAAAVMDSLDATKRKNLQAAAKMVDRIIAKTRETIVDYGLESDDTVDAWSRSWNHYVPLMREQLDDVVMGGMGTGQGFSIKGKETKGRTGSTKKVVDILANINMQRERAIVRGEKNRVATALLGLVKDNPNKDFWRIAESGEIPSTQTIDKKTGLVITQIDPLFKSRDNALVVKVNGVEKVILFNEDNPRAMRMAVALKNMDAANLEGLLGNVASVTRYLAAVNTQYNPIFGVVNMVRDFQDAAINMQKTPLAGKQKQVLGNAPKAIWQIGMELRAQRKGEKTGSEYGSLWEEFQEQGGQTGYRDMFNNSAERSKQLQNLLKPDAWADTKAGRFFTVNGALKVPLEILRKTALRPMLDLLSDYNEAIENGVRLSAYKAALDIGMSKPRAAELAKNLTVNFNRKGQVAQQVGALYAFFNASVQGAARMGQTIFDMEPGKPKTIRLSSLGKKIVGGGVLLGSVQALLLAASGFGDDEPPEFIRKRNLVIPNPLSEKGYISIPMPLGYHVLTNLGRIPTEYALSGFKGGSKRAISLLDVMSDIYNPIGGSGLSMQTLAPSVLDPFAALAENKDFTGRAIAKQSFNKVTPGHALGRDTSSMLAQGMAQVINYATGGTEYTRGELSPTPDQIDYLIGQVTGGVGREASKVSQSTQAIATGDELPWHKVPLVGRFYGDADSPSAKQSAYYNLMDDVRRHSAEVKGLRNDGKATEAIEYMAENPQATLHIAANAAERQVKKLRDRMDDLKEQNAPRESIKEVETQMTEVMQRFAALVQSKKKP